MPGAVATPRDGGYVVSGGWDYCSGCDIATHFLGNAMLPPSQPGEAPSPLFVLIDRADFSIVDNWDVVGLRGTGSRRVVVQDVFVPAYVRTATVSVRRSVHGRVNPQQKTDHSEHRSGPSPV